VNLRHLFILGAVALTCSASCIRKAPEATDPAEVAVGERLFLETRFAQFFFANSAGDPNAVLSVGDPVMDETIGVTENLRGPFKGKSMNCRACHLVDEHGASPGGGVRTYADFARRSPIPDRGDGKTVAPRNSPPLVNSAIARSTALFFHFDGEFPTLDDLVRATFSGRNFGWLPTEKAAAIAHLASVIRGDDGTGDLAQDSGGLPYRILLAGVDGSIPAELRLPPAFRIDVTSVTDLQVFDAVAALVRAYVESLLFAQNSAGDFTGSPFDLFLSKNGLPRQPNVGESDLDYGRRLRGLVDALGTPVWVTPADGAFALHAQDFVFGVKELAGLKIFLTEPSGSAPPSVGNCIVCHAPPKFTDFKFHNVGTAQSEYDEIHGAAKFATFAATIPLLSARSDADLPASADNLLGQGKSLSVPSAADDKLTDLGLWNVFANPHVPGPQPALNALFGVAGLPGDGDLAKTIALFKTPSVRDLSQSAPYFHTGQKDSIEDVIRHYIAFSDLARLGKVFNGAPELSDIVIQPGDVAALAAFLRSLNEDYQ